MKFTVLQAYMDDSGSEPTSQFFVLGGFIASDDKWRLFSIAWAEALSQYPGAAYFKATEAFNLRGEFERRRGWTHELRDKLVSRLDEIIASYAALRISVAIQNRDFYRHIREIPAVERTHGTDLPYVHLVARAWGFAWGYSKACSAGPVDFIHDEQEGVEYSLEFVREFFENFATRHGGADLVGSPPVFGNDRHFLPLQAADLYAWQVRRHLEKGCSLKTLRLYGLSGIAKIRYLKTIMTTREIVEMRDSLLQQGRDLAVRRPDIQLHPYSISARKAATRQRKRMNLVAAQFN